MIRAADLTARAGFAALALGGAAAFAPPAYAQTNATARADALFTQGKAALEAGDYARACPALQESYAIDPANGTLLALGLCHEGQGRTATAWRELRTAAEGATKDGRADRAQFAQAHISKLEPRLSKVTIVVPADAPAGFGVELDGAPLPPGEWGKAYAIDPGHHAIAARAPGRKAWTAAVDVAPEHDAQTIKVGALVTDAPASAPLPASVAEAAPPPVVGVAPTSAPPADANVSTASPDVPTPGAWKRPTGWILGGVGLAALGVGTYFGVSAITKSHDARSQCTPSDCTSAAAVRENDDAKTAATISDVAVGVGLAAVAAGAYLVLTAPSVSRPSSSLRVAPFVGTRQAGLAFERAW